MLTSFRTFGRTLRPAARRCARKGWYASVANLTFRYSFAHASNATSADYFQMIVEAQDGSQTVVLQERGGPVDDDAWWARASISLARWAGQTIHLIVVACDAGRPSLIEAAVDDIRIRNP